MPQMNKGGKFIFGESEIRPDGLVQLPTQAVEEYAIAAERKVYLFTGSKITGGFCVTRQGLLLKSKLGHILTENPSLLHYEVGAGTFVPYKGRAYCWTAVSAAGEIRLTEKNDDISAPYPWNAALVHSQQRYCLYDGRERAAFGKSGAFQRRDPVILKYL